VSTTDSPLDFSDRILGEVLRHGLDQGARTLEQLSGQTIDPPYETSLIERVAEAWETPLRSLTCAQVCMLVGQQFGMQWLAKPVLRLLAIAPRAEFRFYPGDLTLGALQAHRDLMSHAPAETRAWLNGDFDWMAEAFAFSEGLPDEAAQALSAARKAAALN